MELHYLSDKITPPVETMAAADNISHLPHFNTSTTNKNGAKPKMLQTVIDVLGEGLKQNFLGADINMEFLTLSIRSYASTTLKALQQAAKPLSGKFHINHNNRHQQLNQSPC